MCGPTGRKEPLWLWGYPNAPDPEHDRAHEPQPGTDLYLRGKRARRSCGLSALSVHKKENAHCFMVGVHANEQKALRDLVITVESKRVRSPSTTASFQVASQLISTKTATVQR